MVDKGVNANIKLSLLFAWEWKYQGNKDDICGVSRLSRTTWAALCTAGFYADFTTHGRCDPGLVTSSLWASVSLSFPVLSSHCLSCSVDAMLGKTKLSKTVLAKSLSTVIRSPNRIGSVLSRASASLCDCSASRFSCPPTLSCMIGWEGGKWGIWIKWYCQALLVMIGGGIWKLFF